MWFFEFETALPGSYETAFLIPSLLTNSRTTKPIKSFSWYISLLKQIVKTPGALTAQPLTIQLYDLNLPPKKQKFRGPYDHTRPLKVHTSDTNGAISWPSLATDAC